MHLLPTTAGSVDEDGAAVDLGHAPADLVILSFTDSDLAVAGAAHGAAAAEGEHLPSLRLVRLAALKHPFSVDLYIDTVIRHARVVLVRLLGGLDYWRYGLDELSAAARHHGVHLAVVPGDDRPDGRLDEASTLPAADRAHLYDCFQAGGAENVRDALRLMAARAGWAGPPPRAPRALPAAGRFAPGCRPAPAKTALARTAPAGAPHVLILLYRSVVLAADTAPVTALADALAKRGARVTSLYATSLKDDAAATILATELASARPDVIVNTTAFSARRGRVGAVTDAARVPVLQAVLAGQDRDAWEGSGRGLAPADLAAAVVLPEVDGRLMAGVLSFKQVEAAEAIPGFAPRRHAPEPSRVEHVAALALAWAALRRTKRADRRLACVLSDYPGRDGRAGYAVGLDTPQSTVAIAAHLRAEGFDVGTLPQARELMAALTTGPLTPVLRLADYRSHVATLPLAFRQAVEAAWGDPADDPAVAEGAFGFRILRSGALVVAVQPDRGAAMDRRADYHSAERPPRHAFIAFYLWLRAIERIHAMIHLGTHGTLEWLPGKAVALGPACAPEVVMGPVPVVYPFIVSNPGEAAQAKRRIAAVTLGHMTPPLTAAGLHGAAATLKPLLDEYAQATMLDGRRARLLATRIVEAARETGLAADVGLDLDGEPGDVLSRLDAWLCDIEEMRIGDGLHVFGGPALSPVDEPPSADLAAKLARSGPAELRRLVVALDGGFVQPGPSGAPARGRLDVLPTGRNLFTVDPRAVPTRTAYETGRRVAADLVTRHAQDHGDWPRRLVIDLWSSATMRTGGEDLAQAFALMGVLPSWDHNSARVSGYEILPQARLDWPRVDVTLRISGLFRDTFPAQIALFDAASRAVAALDETDDENALAESRRARPDGAPGPRVFGPAPGRYGLGLGRTIMADRWEDRAALGRAYLDATDSAFGAGGAPVSGGEAFAERVAAADAFAHTNDLPGSDLLDAGPTADHQGGFAAAAFSLGATPALYAIDTTRPERAAVRTLPEEIARVVRGRATNPRWIAGQMRHGHRGAAEIAETVDNLFAFAALTEAVPARHFDLLFDATLGDAAVLAFLRAENPAAARSIATRFAHALERGFWTSRRNSAAATLADLLEPTP